MELTAMIHIKKSRIGGGREREVFTIGLFYKRDESLDHLDSGPKKQLRRLLLCLKIWRKSRAQRLPYLTT